MKKVTQKERIEIIDKFSLVQKQKTRLNNTLSFLIKNRVDHETRKKFKKVVSIINIVYNERKNIFLETTI